MGFKFYWSETIVENGSELIIYYLAGSSWFHYPQIGMATSTDGGLTWSKYNDPTTITPPYTDSDPILRGDRPYDTQGILGCSVLNHEWGWEMFYVGRSSDNIKSICYATSLDGIIWEKDTINSPIFTPSQDPIATNGFEKPSTVIKDGLHFMYYDYNATPDGIGLATANVVSVENSLSGLPFNHSLYQNYPNPFNPTTTIKLAVAKESNVNLSIYNVLGELVTTLVNEQMKAGYYEYELNASNLASGVYLYRLQAGSFVETKKMVLLR